MRKAVVVAVLVLAASTAFAQSAGEVSLTRWVHYHVSYKSSLKTWRDAQSPALTLKLRTANCTDFSVLIVALLKEKGLDSRARCAAVSVPWSSQLHMVVLASDGAVLDGVTGDVFPAMPVGYTVVWTEGGT